MLQKDVRQPSHDGFKFSVADQVESLKWDPKAEHSFLVSALPLLKTNTLSFKLVLGTVDGKSIMIFFFKKVIQYAMQS